ncbi:MAG: DUF333 domain-containing protein [Spirochaetales bacterium]|nr:DUF333 domain-containing protein [Leptospiraceae bacterium]MCP5480572.1 DUF333 domain-containing protein [Spirochaetales bacterium]MCP5483922.1 DUF333 domain-containing protein [Spirochaetales bacterium]
MKGLLLAAPLLVTLCCAPQDRSGAGNPASQHCADNGGQLSIVRSNAGDTGYCLFPDASVCDEWAFFRGDCGKGQCITRCVPGQAGAESIRLDCQGTAVGYGCPL